MAVFTPTPVLKRWLNSLGHNMKRHSSGKGNCRAEERSVGTGVTDDKRLVNMPRMCYFENKNDV